MENARTKEQQTPRVHPLYGFLRESALGQGTFFVFAWVFHTSYLASTVLAFSCLFITQPPLISLGLPLLEYGSLVGVKMAQGEIAPGLFRKGSLSVSGIYHALQYISVSAVPLYNFRVRKGRHIHIALPAPPLPTLSPPPLPTSVPSLATQHPSELGPRVFSGSIVYRLVSNTAIVLATASAFNKFDRAMTHQRILITYGVALGVCVASLVAVVCSMQPGYRHTFVGSTAGRKYWRNYWKSDLLHELHQDVDEQRAKDVLIDLHPSYAPVDLVVLWTLEKAAEIEGSRVPSWLTYTFCDAHEASTRVPKLEFPIHKSTPRKSRAHPHIHILTASNHLFSRTCAGKHQVLGEHRQHRRG